MPVCGQSLFGASNNYIKVGKSEFVAVEGATTAEKLILSDLRIPYKQILKSKVTIKKDQQDYLLNHLGLGDNATFLAIKVIYSPKSVIEEDNYLNWSYFNDINTVNKIGKVMVLTGNSTNRIPQLFISNPNEKYDVQLEVMVAVVDEDSFFNYSPVVYFTEEVKIPNVEYNGPYNTTLGDNFEAIVSLSDYYYTLTLAGLVEILIDYIKGSNGVLIDLQISQIELYDDEENQISFIDSEGEFILKFNITDSLDYSISDEKNIKISVISGDSEFNVSNNINGNYIINDLSNPPLTLLRGETYTFNVNSPGHPFFIKTKQTIGIADQYNDGLTNNGTDDGTIIFVVSDDTPNTLYYNCQYHTTMKGIINIIPTLSSNNSISPSNNSIPSNTY